MVISSLLSGLKTKFSYFLQYHIMIGCTILSILYKLILQILQTLFLKCKCIPVLDHNFYYVHIHQRTLKPLHGSLHRIK